MKLAFSLFCKNLWLNLLICAQICAGTVAGIIAVGVISNSYTVYNLTKNSQDAYAYMPESEGVYYTESNLVKYVSSGKIILNRSRNEALMWTYAGDAKTPDEASLNKQYDLNGVFSLGDISSNIIKQQLSKGRWFNESEQDKVIECVVITNDSSLTIGSILTFGALGVERDENGKIIGKIFTNKYTFKIVGFLKNGSKSLEFTKRTLPAEALRLSDMFETVDYNENNYFKKIGSSIKHDENYYKTPKLTIYCSYKNFFESSLGDYNKGSMGDNAIFKFSENLSQNEKEQILNELKMEAGIVDFKSLRQKELIIAKNQVSQYLPVLLCFIVMIIVGSICVSVLSMINNKNTFKAYILCGMSLKKGCFILAMHTVILIFISASLSVGVFALVSVMRLVPFNQMALGLPITLFIIFNFLLSACLSLFASLPILKKYHELGAEL